MRAVAELPGLIPLIKRGCVAAAPACVVPAELNTLVQRGCTLPQYTLCLVLQDSEGGTDWDAFYADEERERCFLVGVQLKKRAGKHGYGVQESLEELGRLADTAGLEVTGSTFQMLEDVSSHAAVHAWHADAARRRAYEGCNATFVGVCGLCRPCATCLPPPSLNSCLLPSSVCCLFRSIRAPTLALAKSKRSRRQ